MKRLVLLMAMSALAGCASMESAFDSSSQQTAAGQMQPVTVSSLSDLTYSPLNVYEKTVEIRQPVDSHTQRIEIDGVATAVAAWKLPDYGVTRITLSSEIKRNNYGDKAHAFMPEVWLLDDQYNALKRLTADQLKYGEQGIMSRETLSLEWVLDHRKPADTLPVYLVVLTTEQARQNSVMVANIAKEYAKVRGIIAPPMPDVYATAAEEGVLRLKVTPIMGHASATPAPAAVLASDYATNKPPVTKPALPDELDTLSKQLLDDVQTALSRSDITTAMELRNNIKQTHAELQVLFESSYGKSASELRVIEQSLLSSKDASSLNGQFKRALIQTLIKGDAPSALSLIDRSETLITKVDNLF